MPMKPLKAAPAERAVELYLQTQGWETHRAVAQVVRKGPLVFSPSNDLLGCIDILAVHRQHGFWLVQVTGGGYSAVTERRRKVAKVGWPFHLVTERGGLRVSVLATEARPDPKSQRRRQDFARIHDLTVHGWRESGEVVLPPPPAPKPRPKKIRNPSPATAPVLLDPEDPPL